jgi:hypothetical protein
MIGLIPDESVTPGENGQIAIMARYPALEALRARPWRMLACPRECMLQYSWYRAESAELERRAAAGYRTTRLTR